MRGAYSGKEFASFVKVLHIYIIDYYAFGICQVVRFSWKQCIDLDLILENKNGDTEISVANYFIFNFNELIKE